MEHLRRAWATSFLVGFFSLGQEVLWVRIASFADGNTPQTFGLVLGVFLLGIVLGSLQGKRLCSRAPTEILLRQGALVLALSGGIDILAPWLIIALPSDIWWTPLMVLLILLTSATKAVMFPIVHHLGSRAGATDTGRSVSRVYFMNILGATLSPILIGFWALDHVSSQWLMQGMGIGSLALALAVLPAPARRPAWQPITAGAVVMLGLPLIGQSDPYALLRTLAFKEKGRQIAFLLENRQGVIHTLKNPVLGDAVFGGNIYDGRLSTDLGLNSNHIDRVYLLSALHPNPKRVLVVGVSGGPWTRVLAAFPTVEHIDAVEINPGYLELINEHPEIGAILRDPRIDIHIDDGRRWLRRYQGPPFDLVVMQETGSDTITRLLFSILPWPPYPL